VAALVAIWQRCALNIQLRNDPSLWGLTRGVIDARHSMTSCTNPPRSGVAVALPRRYGNWSLALAASTLVPSSLVESFKWGNGQAMASDSARNTPPFVKTLLTERVTCWVHPRHLVRPTLSRIEVKPFERRLLEVASAIPKSFVQDLPMHLD